MKCSILTVDGRRMIVCSPQRIAQPKLCCKCGAIATRECDWKMPKRANGRPSRATCDRGLCDSCTYAPASEKDLCPDHKKAWDAHPANQA